MIRLVKCIVYKHKLNISNSSETVARKNRLKPERWYCTVPCSKGNFVTYCSVLQKVLQPIRALGVTVYNREGNLFSIYSISDYSCLSLVTFGYGCLIMALSTPMQRTDNKTAQTTGTLIKNPLEYIYNLYHDRCSEM